MSRRKHQKLCKGCQKRARRGLWCSDSCKQEVRRLDAENRDLVSATPQMRKFIYDRERRSLGGLRCRYCRKILVEGVPVPAPAHMPSKPAASADVKSSIIWLGRPQTAARDDAPWLEHVVPRLHGGKTVVSNLVVACGACNENKGNKRGLELIFPRGRLTFAENGVTVREIEAPEVLPSGTHEAKVARVDEGRARNTSRRNIEVTFELRNGTHISKYYSLEPKNPAAWSYFVGLLRATGMDRAADDWRTERPAQVDTDDMVGHDVMLTLTQRTIRGRVVNEVGKVEKG